MRLNMLFFEATKIRLTLLFQCVQQMKAVNKTNENCYVEKINKTYNKTEECKNKLMIYSGIGKWARALKGMKKE